MKEIIDANISDSFITDNLHASGIDTWKWSKIEKVYIENEKILPCRGVKIESYNPFNFIDSKESWDNFLAQSIFTSFLSLNIDKEEEIIKFTQDYGYLYFDLKSLDLFNIITYMDGTTVDYSDDVFNAFSLDLFKVEWCKLYIIVNLYQIIGNQELDTKEFYDEIILAKKYFKNELLEDIIQNNNMEEKTEGFSKVIFDKEISINFIVEELRDRLNKIRICPVANYQNFTIRESWSSIDLISVLYYIFYISIRDEKILRKCGNKSCNNFFYIKGDDMRKKFCMDMCAKVEANRRYRKKKRMEKKQI